MTLDEITEHLQSADSSLVDALKAAAEHPSILVPAVLEIAAKAAQGNYLIPKQRNLLFFGLHVLSAAAETRAYQPFLEVLQLPEDSLEQLFGEGFVETSTQLALGLFDGNAEPLYAMVEDGSVDGTVRWSLFQVLARLTWEKRIPPHRLVDLLDRFDQGNLAPLDDAAWEGWQDVIQCLGLVSFEDRVRKGWAAGRIRFWNEADRREYVEGLHQAAANPNAPELFAELGIVPMTDPAKQLANHSFWPGDRAAELAARDPSDPAADIKLNHEELNWLSGFLACDTVPETTMDLEELDGFFCALIAGPETVLPSEYFPTLWCPDDDNAHSKGPRCESLEQAQYVLGLLTRHWNTIAVRLNAGVLYEPFLFATPPEQRAHGWAVGFLLGLGLRRDAWTPLIHHKKVGPLAVAIFSLAADGTDRTMEAPDAKTRQDFVEALPMIIRSIHHFWRKPSERPVRSSKAGRNDPCPCGSGRKYKKCCGAGSAELN
jgi:uncharacterized protein